MRTNGRGQSASEPLGERGIGRDTSVWMRRGNHSANRKVLCNVCPAKDGLGVEENWLSTDTTVPGSSC